MKEFICPKCNSKDLFTSKNGNQTGLYCSDCGKWIKWMSKDDLRIFDEQQRRIKELTSAKTSELFKKEIGYIADETLKKIVIDTLDTSPECIQHIPASSSGKYHPVYSLGNGGLVRHVRAAVGIAHSMIETEIFKNIALGIGADDYETIMIYKDVAYAALILHDCMKPDDTHKHGTRFDHPILAANHFKETAAKYVTNENMDYMKAVIPLIHGCVASHMGEWQTAPYAKGIILPKPKLGIEEFVHMCDYLASRKFLLFDFDVYDKVKR